MARQRRKRMPVRDRIVQNYTEQMAQCLRVMNMVRDIPMQVPIYFEQYIRWRENKMFPVAGIIIKINPGSFRLELIASDGYVRGGYRKPLGTIRYEEIKTWRLLDQTDLGLLIGCDHKYPLMDVMLKEGLDAWKDKKNRYRKPEKEKK